MDALAGISPLLYTPRSAPFNLSSTLPATSESVVIKDWYLQMFLHPALYHIIQILGFRHKKVERHMVMLKSLNDILHCL